MYYVYVLRSIKDQNFYIGSTSDLKKRIEEHNSGMSKSTNYRAPFELIYYEASRNRIDAVHREKYLKSSYGHRYPKDRMKNDCNESKS